MAPTADGAAAPRARVVGMVLVLAGLVLLLWPTATPQILASWVALGAVVFGVRELTRTFAGAGGRIEFPTGLLGLISIFGGVVMVLTPFVSDTATSMVLGIYWLVAGAFEVAGALLRPAARLERLLVGIISLTAGTLVLVLPTSSLVVVVWLAGGWLLTAGAIVLLTGSIASGQRRAVA